VGGRELACARALMAGGLVLLFFACAACFACTPAHHPHAVEEVPIGLSVPGVPGDPNRPGALVADREPAMVVDASVAPEADAQADSGSEQTPDADGGGAKKHPSSGRNSKPPTAITGNASTPAAAPTGGVGEERARLEAKMANHEATAVDLRALMNICAKQRDKPCIKRAMAAMRSLR
jgi:hypothetical protein